MGCVRRAAASRGLAAPGDAAGTDWAAEDSASATAAAALTAHAMRVRALRNMSMLTEASGSAVAYDCAEGSLSHRVFAQLRHAPARWPRGAPTRRALGPTRRLARSTHRCGVARARGDAMFGRMDASWLPENRWMRRSLVAAIELYGWTVFGILSSAHFF